MRIRKMTVLLAGFLAAGIIGGTSSAEATTPMVTQPAGGNLLKGTTATIAWAGFPADSKVKIVLRKTGVPAVMLKDQLPQNGTGTWVWQVPKNENQAEIANACGYYVRIRAYDSSGNPTEILADSREFCIRPQLERVGGTPIPGDIHTGVNTDNISKPGLKVPEMLPVAQVVNLGYHQICPTGYRFRDRAGTEAYTQTSNPLTCTK